MPRGGPLIMENYIYPALEQRNYGEILKWMNRDIGLFRLTLVHKKNSMWKRDYVRVFTDWDKLKKRPACGSKLYFTESKQRFKNALSKCPSARKASDEILKKEGIQKNKNHLYYIYDESSRKTPKSKKPQRRSTKPKAGQCLNVVQPITTMTPPPSPQGCGQRYDAISYQMPSQTEAVDDALYDQLSLLFSDNTAEDDILTDVLRVVPSFTDVTTDYDIDAGDVFVRNGEVMLSSVILENDIQKFDDSEAIQISEFLKYHLLIHPS